MKMPDSLFFSVSTKCAFVLTQKNLALQS